MTEERKQYLKRCSSPWFSTMITGYPNKTMISPCCYLPESLTMVEDISKIDFQEIWNNEVSKSIRTANSNDSTCRETLENNYCLNCLYYDSNNNLDINYHLCGDSYNTIDDDWTQEQKDNLELAKLEFEKGETNLKSTPIMFSALQGINCNLNCRMCFQRKWIKEDAKNAAEKISAETILKLKPYLKKALLIALIGGEPFAMPECTKLLKALIEDPDFKTLRISLWSNAILIDKYFDLLKSHRKITLFTSPDSIGDTYERIRRGAKWDKFESNIKQFQKIGKENNLKWEVKTHNLLMKSSIDKIEELANWCVENNIEACFSLLWSNPGQEEFCEQEDVMVNPQLLDSVLNWEIKISRAIEVFKKAGNQQVAVDLLTFYSEKIKKAYAEAKNIKPDTNFPNNKKGILKKMSAFSNKIKNTFNKHKESNNV